MNRTRKYQKKIVKANYPEGICEFIEILSPSLQGLFFRGLAKEALMKK